MIRCATRHVPITGSVAIDFGSEAARVGNGRAGKLVWTTKKKIANITLGFNYTVKKSR